jgi:haloalkane dehalogenase
MIKMAKKIVRTPEERFNNLPDFSYEQHYIEISGVRIHYIDEGKREEQQETILCLHGEPTWSFLYRKMIPIFIKAGYRVIAPDYIGFGRSDKYTEVSDYSFHTHYDMIVEFIKLLDLSNMSVICQDWGYVGLVVAVNHPERFSRLVILNTFLPDGIYQPSAAWFQFKQFAETTELSASFLLTSATVTGSKLTKDVLDAYDAPFPDKTYKAGMQAFPLIVPLKPEDPGAKEGGEARRLLKDWKKPAITMFSDTDPIMVGLDKYFRDLIPGTIGQPEITIKDGGHFLQEDKGEEIADHIVEFVKRTPL